MHELHERKRIDCPAVRERAAMFLKLMRRLRTALSSVKLRLGDLTVRHAGGCFRMAREETAKGLRTKLKAFVGSLQEDERQLLGSLFDAPWDVTDLLDEWGSNVREMHELNMSFNLQYLQLQQKMQDEARRYTLLSNVMKTKHDTVKNTIANVR